MSTPRVSVVMPVRNEERFVERAVVSILDQTLDDLELIVVDDGSTDRTGEILAAASESDPRIRIVHPDGQGLVDALNTGVALARGTFIARMDADDVALPERFARQVDELETRPTLGVLGARVRYIDASGRAVGVWDVPVGASLVHWTLAFGTPIAHPTVMMRKAALPPVPYRTSDPHAEDYDLWVRLSRETTLDNLAEILLERRVHGTSVSDQNLSAQEASTLRIRQRAIGNLLGREPSVSQVTALTKPQSAVELVAAARLLGRLYLASRGGAAVRRDAARRLVAAAKSLWRSR